MLVSGSKMPLRGYYEYEYLVSDVVVDHGPFATYMPSVDRLDIEDEEESREYLRDDDDDGIEFDKAID